MKTLLLIFSLLFFYSANLSKALANNLSIKQEIERALDSGLNWLNLEQNMVTGSGGRLTELLKRHCRDLLQFHRKLSSDKKRQTSPHRPGNTGIMGSKTMKIR